MLVNTASQRYTGSYKQGEKTGVEYTLTTSECDIYKGNLKHVFRTFNTINGSIELIDVTTYRRLSKSIKTLFNL